LTPNFFSTAIVSSQFWRFPANELVEFLYGLRKGQTNQRGIPELVNDHTGRVAISLGLDRRVEQTRSTGMTGTDRH
jgi:hypothetical protein